MERIRELKEKNIKKGSIVLGVDKEISLDHPLKVFIFDRFSEKDKGLFINQGFAYKIYPHHSFGQTGFHNVEKMIPGILFKGYPCYIPGGWYVDQEAVDFLRIRNYEVYANTLEKVISER